MQYRILGNTGLYVSALSLGTMGYGGNSDFWRQIGDLSQEHINTQIGQAVEAGINLIDTANYYAAGESERAVGAALKSISVDRGAILLATKLRLRMGPGPNDVGLSRHHILNSVDASLSRLDTDHIDLLYLHGPDPLTPIEETLRALDDLIKSGKVRYIGLSNFPAWKMMQAVARADRLGMSNFCASQNYYSLVTRDVETDILPLCHEENLTLIVWSPLAGGFLAGTQDTKEAKRRDEFNFPPIPEDAGRRCRAALQRASEALNLSPATVSIAYLLHKPGVASVTIAAKNDSQFESALAAADVTLDDEIMGLLDECSPPPKTYPGWMQDRIASDRDPGALTTARLSSVPK